MSSKNCDANATKRILWRWGHFTNVWACFETNLEKLQNPLQILLQKSLWTENSTKHASSTNSTLFQYTLTNWMFEMKSYFVQKYLHASESGLQIFQKFSAFANWLFLYVNHFWRIWMLACCEEWYKSTTSQISTYFKKLFLSVSSPNRLVLIFSINSFAFSFVDTWICIYHICHLFWCKWKRFFLLFTGCRRISSNWSPPRGKRMSGTIFERLANYFGYSISRK